MNYKKIALSFILLFLNVNSHYNEEIFDFFYINKIEILSFFYLAAIVAYSREAFINNFNTIKYIITYLKFYIFNFDPNIQNEYGRTSLHEYCIGSKNYLKAITLLLAHPNINPNIKNKNGNTPLDSACICKRIEVIKLLLNCPQTNPNIQDKDGWTPLYSCCVKTTQMDLEIIKLLLAHPKTNPNSKNNYGDAPLYTACLHDNVECINLLLNHPKIENNIDYKQTDLHKACSNKKTKNIENLLAKFHPNMRDENGNTALHLACINNNAIIVKLLINDKRTSLDSKNDAGHTPLIIAANSEKAIEIIPILITHRIGYDERQYLFYKACKSFSIHFDIHFGIFYDLIKPILGYYEAITISQQFHNFPKKNPLQLEQIRKNCITIVCQNKGYINPYQRAIL
jgi:ankyrin repeat protein